MAFMRKVKIKPFNVIDHTDLPEITVDRLPVDRDPLGIGRCQTAGRASNWLSSPGKNKRMYQKSIYLLEN